MADDLSAAPQTGATEVATPVADTSASSAPASTGGAEKPKTAPSTREALKEAMRTVETRAPNETDKAAAVLKGGAGADDQAVTDHAKAAEEAAKAGETDAERSERAKKGWETRRANEAAAEVKPVEAKPAVAEPPKPAESKPEPSKHQPPSRLSAEAKAAWEAAPEPLRAEVVRMHDEMTAGLTKHKEGAERYAELSEYEQMSQEFYKQPLKDTLRNYAELDKMLHTDPLAALERIAGSMTYKDENGKDQKWTLKQLAHYVVEQDKETFDNPQSELHRQIEDLKKQVSSLTQGMTDRQKQEAEQRTTSIQDQVANFAKEHTRFDELFSDMETFLASPKFRTADYMADLKRAYEKAERLNPAPQLSPPAPEIPAPAPAAQTRAGTASVSGAPGAGSNPAGKRPVPPTSRDALKQAFAAKGLAVT